MLAKETLETSALRLVVMSSMPKATFGAAHSVDKFEAMILGSMAGAECLDDLEKLGLDPAFAEMATRCYTAKSFGNFLRAFDTYHCKLLQHALIRQSLKLRRTAVGDMDSFTLDLDSTSNQQCTQAQELPKSLPPSSATSQIIQKIQGSKNIYVPILATAM